MVATEQKKVRTNGPDGKLRWVYPEEMHPQARAAADLLGGELLDWDGNEVEPLDETYEEYVNRMPSKAELRRYPKPVYYAEVRHPGCTLQPFPRMGAITSTPSGLWTATNAVQERAIREHIQISTAKAGHPTNPDDLKLTEDEMAVMEGRRQGDIQYCQNAGCYFVTCSMHHGKLHVLTNGHKLDYQPRSN